VSLGLPSRSRGSRLRPSVRTLRRWTRRYRRWLAAGLAGLAVLLAIGELRPPPPPTGPMVVAARNLPAGHVLQAADLATVRMPTGLLPATAATVPDRVVGERLAGPLTTGEPITEAATVGPGLLTGQPPDTVALPVRVSDSGAAALVAAGDRIDLVAAVPGEGASSLSEVAADLPVLFVPSAAPVADDAGFALGPAVGASDLGGGLVVVAARPAQVRTIVAGAADAPLWLTIRGSSPDVPSAG